MLTPQKTKVPAGGALSVDREQFSNLITQQILENPFITVHRQEVKEIPRQTLNYIAAGPLVSDALAEKIENLCGNSLHFFDAAAPIVSADSIDMENAFSVKIR